MLINTEPIEIIIKYLLLNYLYNLIQRNFYKLIYLIDFVCLLYVLNENTLSRFIFTIVFTFCDKLIDLLTFFICFLYVCNLTLTLDIQCIILC